MKEIRQEDNQTGAGAEERSAFEEREFTNALFASAAHAILIIDADGVIQSVNSFTLSFLGYKLDALLGKNISMIMPSPHREEHDRYIKNYLETGKKNVIGIGREVKVKHRSGRLIPVFLSIGEFKQNGKPMFAGILHDQTEQKRYEAELKRKNHLLHLISQAHVNFLENQAPETIFHNLLDDILDLTGSGFGFIGEVHYTDTGGPELCIYAITSDDHQPVKRIPFAISATSTILRGLDPGALIRHFIQSGDPLLSSSPGKDLRITFPGQESSVHLETFLALPFFRGSDLIGMMGIGDNPDGYDGALVEYLSPLLKTATSIIDAYKGELRRLKTEKELLRAREEAEAASRTKTEFLTRMSHEIRTPMNGILGMADLLQETPLNEEQKRYLSLFTSAGEALLNLINDIVDYSRMESGRIALESTTFDLAELLQQISTVISLRASGKGLSFQSSFPEDLPRFVGGDPLRLRQVLINLLSNALKFTEQGEISLVVERVPDPGDTISLRFVVTDTGIGIPEERQADIFDGFSQGDTSSTRVHGGTGLGLSISRHLVRLMGGDIHLHSEPNRGSSFEFLVRFKSHDYSSSIHSADFRLSGSSILLVDSNQIRSLSTSGLLKKHRALVEHHVHPDSLVDSLQSRSSRTYDMVLYYHDPSPTPISLGERIHSLPGYENLPLMLVTTDVLKGGNDGYLTHFYSILVQPISTGTLVETMEKCILDSRQQTPIPFQERTGHTPSPSRHYTILLVDDSGDNRLLIENYLKKTDYSLHMAENGEEAVRKFKEREYDLILMDMQMPVMDGYEATREIRRLEKINKRRTVPIIALTAHSLTEEMEKSLHAGCNRHITKPIRKARLMELLQELI